MERNKHFSSINYGQKLQNNFSTFCLAALYLKTDGANLCILFSIKDPKQKSIKVTLEKEL
jgi:hypothetical protein